jgi:YVTN family beta-propeller protein
MTCNAQAHNAHAYLGVVNKTDGTASFINLTTQETDFTVHVGYLPHEITSCPDGTKAFVSNYGKEHVRSRSPNNHPGNSISVIDMKSKAKISEISLGETNCAPHGMVCSKDSRKLYVTCEDRKEIAIIDLDKERITKTISTEQEQSHMVVLSDDQTQAFTSNFAAGTVTALDLKSGSVLKQIPIGAGVEGVSASSYFVYGTSVLENLLAKIDPITFEVLKTVPTDRSPVRVLATPNSQRLVVNNSASGTVQVFDAFTLELIKTIPVGKQPIGLVIPNDDYAYSANMNDNSISVIDLRSLEVVANLKTGNKPDGITYIPFQ